MKADLASPADADSTQPTPYLRYIAAAVLLVVAGVYLGAITLDKLPKRLTPTDLGVLVIAVAVIGALLRPEFLNRLTHFKVGTVEFELQQLQQGQRKQQNELDDVRFVLTLLLQEEEIKHLKNLQKGNTDYKGNKNVCTELRKLRTLGLIRSLGEHHIGELENKAKFDLAKYVELTDRGKHYLERLADYQKDLKNASDGKPS